MIRSLHLPRAAVTAMAIAALAACLAPTPLNAVNPAQAHAKAAAMAARATVVRPCAIPDSVRGRRAAEVEPALRERGFAISREEVYSTLAAGMVVDFVPGKHPPCSVLLKVSRGQPGHKPPPVDLMEVPRLVGRTLAEARQVVAGRFDLKPSRVEGVETDVVTAQGEQPGQRRPRGWDIAVSVSDGSLTVVPPLRAVQLPEAVKMLRERSLVPSVAERRESRFAQDAVIDQEPRAGAHVKRGTRVALTLATAPRPEVPPPLAVPDGSNRSLAEADQVFRASGFRAQIRERIEDDAPPGWVLRQVPPAGSLVPQAGVVELTLSTGVPVPKVLGMTGDDARAALARFKVFAPDAEEGALVRQQDPSPGSRAAAGSQVNLVLEAPPRIAVPRLVDLAVDRARDVLAAKGFKLAGVEAEENSAAPQVVLRQSPAADTLVPAPLDVSVVVSKGLPVPAVTTLPQADAENALPSFQVSTELVESDAPAGTVVSQSPTATEFAAGGSPIVLRVSKGPAIVTPIPPAMPRWRQVLRQWGEILVGAAAVIAMLAAAVASWMQRDGGKGKLPVSRIAVRFHPEHCETEFEREPVAAPVVRVAARLEHAPSEEKVHEGATP